MAGASAGSASTEGETLTLSNPFAAERLESNGLLRVYSYGSPACVDADLADYARSYVTNCVLHDDVVPRLNPTSIRALLRHLLHIRETWVRAHLTDDVSAYAERVRAVWAPRWRQSFTMLKSTSKSGLRRCRKKLRQVGAMKGGRRSARVIVRDSIGGDGLRINDGVAGCDGGEQHHAMIGQECGRITEQPELEEDTQSPPEEDNDNDDTAPQAEGIDVDGDLFYEAEEDLLESEDEHFQADAADGAREEKQKPEEDEWVPFDEPPMSPSKEDAASEGPEKRPQNAHNPEGGAADPSSTPKTESSPVVLEEVPLPRMFLPGRIVHVYTHRGGYHAACVPRQFRDLRRISLAGSMLSDHTSVAYYEGLLEVKTIRRAPYKLPEWTGFGEDKTCACCASRFTWASTSDSKAQEARDKHNCRSCGGLVCGPCSVNRSSLPDVGITVAVRVCDRCYNDRGNAFLADDRGEGTRRHRSGGEEEAAELMRSFLDRGCKNGGVGNEGGGSNSEGASPAEGLLNKEAEGYQTPLVLADTATGTAAPIYTKHREGEVVKLGRPRPKRSAIVDELASRIPSVPIC